MIWESVGNLGLGIAAATFLIIYLTKLVTSFKRTIDNHLEHHTLAMLELAKALQELSDTIAENTRVIRKLE